LRGEFGSLWDKRRPEQPLRSELLRARTVPGPTFFSVHCLAGRVAPFHFVYGAAFRRTSISLVGLLLFAASCALLPSTVGDGTGSGISNAAGSYLLTPAGTNNYTLHAYLADLGLPIYRGDTLIYSWRANNGSGPPIYFEIHAHPITGGYFKYYNATAISISNGTWTAQTTDRYMVYWVNLSNTTRVNLTYSFVLLVAQPDAWPLYIVPAVIVLVAIAGVAAHVRARKRPPPWAEVGGKDSKETQTAGEAPAPRDQK